MCAINGFNFKDENLILKMNSATHHRGPDGTGIFLDEKISLGHNRLSIIDLSEAAAQPMISPDGSLAIVFNGEIYNFKDLRRELENSYKFKTNSDTEVILAAYKKWGRESVKKLNGIFAFAVWDKTKQELFLARDHVGVKPLYYFLNENTFIFSSEMKAILEHGVPRELDCAAFNIYFRTLYVPEPLTMFKNIYKFPAAHCGFLRGGKLNLTKYWDLKSEAPQIFSGRNNIKEELRAHVIKSVESQLVSDRPVGLYLSGGIDSSAVLDAMSSLRSNIDTFSVGFSLPNKEDEEKFNQDFNFARRTAKYYGTRHNEILLSEGDVLEYFDKSIWHLDEPIANSTAISMLKLADFTKKSGVDVVLGGDGGDELFGGYERYRLSLAASYYQLLPEWLRKIFSQHGKLRKLNTPAGIGRLALFMFQKNEILEKVVSKDFFGRDAAKSFFEKKYFSEALNRQFEELFMEVDRRTWLKDESLARTDKMSMAYGVEARVPLLAKGLVEFAATIPLKYKVSLFNTKIILKEAFRGHIPDFLFNQPKRGWFSPAAKWLRNDKIYAAAEKILSSQYYSETKGLFRWPEIKKILIDHKESKKYNLNILWSILVFQAWAKIYKVRI